MSLLQKMCSNQRDLGLACELQSVQMLSLVTSTFLSNITCIKNTQVKVRIITRTFTHYV